MSSLVEASADGVGTLPRPNLKAVAASFPIAALVAALALTLVIGRSGTGDGLVEGMILFAYTAALSFGVLGWLLVWYRPANRLAVVATGIAWGFALAALLDRYAVLGHLRGWPGTGWALWGAQWVFVPAMWAVPTILVLRFPDGRLMSGRWRSIERMAIAGILAGTLGWALVPYGVVDVAPLLALDHPVSSPLGLPIFAAGLVLWASAAVSSVAAFALRARGASGARRAQLRWVLLGTAGAVTSVALGALTGQPLVSSLGVAVLPASIAVAVLRHGLWDVDVVIHRSIVYGLLTVAILGVYAGTVGLLGGAIGRSLGAPLVATAAVAVGVQPLRVRLQRFAGRLLYGERGDPYAALARLGEQLDAAMDRSGLLEGVTEAVLRAMRLGGAAIEVGDRVVAEAGERRGEPVRVPLTVHGRPVGTLVVTVAGGDDLRRSDRRLLADIARPVAAAVEAERLQAEVEASRARLVTATEEERRRIRRDLHDELGPTLAAIAIEVERAELELEVDPAAASARLEDVVRRVRQAVGSVRAMVEGLRPPALDDLGLTGAVEELARSLGGDLDIAVTVDGDLAELPAAVEVAAYRIAGEAVTNVVRHAGARRCCVRLVRANGQLELVIEDDGSGVGPGPAGIGRRSMFERAAEVGGVLELGPVATGGTRVRAVLPLGGP